MIPARAVSSPTFVTLIVSAPLPFIAPPITSDFTSLLTGFDSPVSIDSLTLDSPLITTPSVGIVEPGRTNTRSPTFKLATVTILVPFFVTSSASSGNSFASSFNAPCAFCTEAISNQCPKSMIVTNVASSHQKSMPCSPNDTAML